MNRPDAAEMILVLDFGGQYNQLIARRVRENHVYCEVHPHTLPLERIRALAPRGIILTGGPNSVYGEGAVTAPKDLFALGIPVLGICYGAQLMAHLCGGRVETAPTSEYGRTEVEIVDTSSPLFQGIPQTNVCWMSHTDYISGLPHGFHVTARTPVCPIAAMENPAERLYAVQFHPEVMHTEHGTEMLRSFVYDVCGCTGTWRMDSFVQKTIEELRQQIGGGRALCALSGGVDSSVAAVLLSKAIGSQLTCVFVDYGLLRKNEGDEVEAVFGRGGTYDVNFVRINARDRFYARLKGVTEPAQKRKIIGEEFIRVFEEAAREIGAVDFLVQGTIYPDVIESGPGKPAVIKSHHNVGVAFLRARCVRRGVSSVALTISSTVSRFRGQASASASLERLRRRRYISFRRQMPSTVRRSRRRASAKISGSTSRHSPICVPSVSWAMGVRMTMRLPCAPLRPATS